MRKTWARDKSPGHGRAGAALCLAAGLAGCCDDGNMRYQTYVGPSISSELDARGVSTTLRRNPADSLLIRRGQMTLTGLSMAEPGMPSCDLVMERDAPYELMVPIPCDLSTDTFQTKKIVFQRMERQSFCICRSSPDYLVLSLLITGKSESSTSFSYKFIGSGNPKTFDLKNYFSDPPPIPECMPDACNTMLP